MRLQKSQKEAVLRWIGEGIESDEMNTRAADFDPPFSVSRPQVQFYRNRRADDIATIRQAGEFDALNAGLAVKAERVRKLQMLAALMEKDLFGGFLWTEQTKALGSGEFMQLMDYEEFNTAEVTQYRGVLDDIAKEVGHRKTGVEHSGGVTLYTVDIDASDESSTT